MGPYFEVDLSCMLQKTLTLAPANSKDIHLDIDAREVVEMMKFYKTREVLDAAQQDPKFLQLETAIVFRKDVIAQPLQVSQYSFWVDTSPIFRHVRNRIQAQNDLRIFSQELIDHTEKKLRHMVVLSSSWTPGSEVQGALSRRRRDHQREIDFLVSCCSNPIFHHVSKSFIQENARFMPSQKEFLEGFRTNLIRRVDAVLENPIYCLVDSEWDILVRLRMFLSRHESL